MIDGPSRRAAPWPPEAISVKRSRLSSLPTATRMPRGLSGESAAGWVSRCPSSHWAMTVAPVRRPIFASASVEPAISLPSAIGISATCSLRPSCWMPETRGLMWVLARAARAASEHVPRRVDGLRPGKPHGLAVVGLLDEGYDLAVEVALLGPPASSPRSLSSEPLAISAWACRGERW